MLYMLVLNHTRPFRVCKHDQENQNFQKLVVAQHTFGKV